MGLCGTSNFTFIIARDLKCNIFLQVEIQSCLQQERLKSQEDMDKATEVKMVEGASLWKRL